MKTSIFLILTFVFALRLAAQDSSAPASPSVDSAPKAVEALDDQEVPEVPEVPKVPGAQAAENANPNSEKAESVPSPNLESEAAPPPSSLPSDATPPVGAEQSTLPPGAEAFVYDPTGKRDPFQPEPDKDSPLQEGGQIQGRRLPSPPPLPQRLREPLESFDLFQLKVSAIIWDIKNPRAMLMDPLGASHVVKLKTRVGKNNGFVVAIREGEVVVVEYNAELDQWVKSFKVLELR
jgi:type IV pilus assembly protein PilP